MEKILEDYAKYEEMPISVIQKYEGLIPDKLMNIWKEKGCGTFLNGYLKVINPDEYKDLLEETSLRFHNAIPVFVTGFGDLLVWREEGYLNALLYRYHVVDTLCSGFQFFLDDLLDEETLEQELKWLPYPDAVKKYGALEYDECFCYVPLLGLGGNEVVEKLEKGKLKEHILINTHFLGPLE